MIEFRSYKRNLKALLVEEKYDELIHQLKNELNNGSLIFDKLIHLEQTYGFLRQQKLLGRERVYNERIGTIDSDLFAIVSDLQEQEVKKNFNTASFLYEEHDTVDDFEEQNHAQTGYTSFTDSEFDAKISEKRGKWKKFLSLVFAILAIFGVVAYEELKQYPMNENCTESLTNIKDKVSGFIKQNRPLNALQTIDTFQALTESNKEVIILLEGRLSRVFDEVNKGIITQEDKILELNRINDSILQLRNRLSCNKNGL